MTQRDNISIRRLVECIVRRVITEQGDDVVDLELTSPRSVIDASRTELQDEWHEAHVMSADDIQLATHSLYDAIVDHYYLEDELTHEQLDRLYDAIFNKLDAVHKDYVGYDG